MTACTTSSSVGGYGSMRRWLPGTTRVAPFSKVKSLSAQLVLICHSMPGMRAG